MQLAGEDEETGWPSDARGATPFDSGGLWWEKIATCPALDGAGRRAFFRDHDVPLVDWGAAFERYVWNHYGTVTDYLVGSEPGPGSASPRTRRSPSSGGIRTTGWLGHGRSAFPMIWPLDVLSYGRPA